VSFWAKAKGPRGPVVNVHLNGRFLPLARQPFADLLIEAMQRYSIVAQEVGGGTQLSVGGEPTSCDIEFEVDHFDATVPSFLALLNRLPMPRGSHMSVNGSVVSRFGWTEGVALYLNGTDLPDGVYADNDVNVLIDNLASALADAVTNMAFWEGPRETAIYLYGRSAATIVQRLRPAIASEPLAQSSRVVILDP
jgi:hypothetical protein